MIVNQIYRVAVASLALLVSASAFSEDGDRWFRIELLVFAHESPQTTEQWQSTPKLVYPGAARFLVDPQLVADNLSQHHAQSNVDDFGRQVLTLLPEPGSLAAQEASIRAEQAAAQSLATTPAEPGDPNTPIPAVDEELELLPMPFIALPSSQQEFRGKAAYMQRSGRYRTLFHETWVQPVADEERALPIILDRSGDTGQWPLLQGSVKFYLSRYLHLQTNLWLNTKGEYLPGVWQMPAPPLGPPSLVIEALPEPEVADNREQWSDTTTVADLVPEGELAAETSLVTEDIGPIYPFRHAVLMQQDRRMRSTEVHYIDHPLLGVVTKISPITKDELESMALAEAASTGNQSQ
ncbi:MAG: CsiV family protein [Halioglobus sp.]